MARFITELTQIPDAKITLKGKGKGKSAFRRIKSDGGELLLKVSGSSFGFRYEETLKGNPKYTLPLIIPEEFADTLYDIARKLGDVDYSPVYETENGDFTVYVRVPMNAGGFVFANICDEKGAKVKPSDKTGVYMKIRAVIKVDSLRVEGDNPKIMLTMVQAKVKNSEMIFEDLLD